MATMDGGAKCKHKTYNIPKSGGDGERDITQIRG